MNMILIYFNVLHINLKAYASCNFSLSFLKVADSYVHCKSRKISETVQARDIMGKWYTPNTTATEII